MGSVHRTLKQSFVFAAILLSVIAQSCINKDDFNFNKLSLSNLHPKWAVPLMVDSIYLKSGEYIEFDGNNVVLVYNNKFDSLGIDQLDSLFNLPQQELKWTNPVPIPADLDGNYEISIKYTAKSPLKFPDMQDINASLIRIDSIFIDQFDINFDPLVLPDLSGNMGITIFSLTHDTVPYSFSIPLPSDNNIYTKQDYVLRLTTSSKGNNMISYQFNTSMIGSLENLAGTTINIGCDAYLNQLKLNKIFSYLGKQQFNMKDSIDVDLQGISGKIDIDNIDLSFDILSSVGVPAQLTINSIGVLTNDGVLKVANSFDPIVINSPDIQHASVPVASTGKIDGSKIISLFGELPKKIYYDVTVETNPQGEIPGTTNFLFPKSGIDVTAHVKLPVDLAVSDFTYADTVAFNLGNDWQSMINDLNFMLITDNHFPFNIEVQAELLDKNYVPLGKLLNQPFSVSSGPVDIETLSVRKGNASTQTIPLSNFTIGQLEKTKYVYVTARASTTQDGYYKVKVTKNDYITVKLGVMSTLNLNGML